MKEAKSWKHIMNDTAGDTNHVIRLMNVRSELPAHDVKDGGLRFFSFLRNIFPLSHDVGSETFVVKAFCIDADVEVSAQHRASRAQSAHTRIAYRVRVSLFGHGAYQFHGAIGEIGR